MNLYPDFSEHERETLAIACYEEIKYWKRMNLSTFSPSSNRLEDDKNANHHFYKKYPGLEKAIEEKRIEMIKRYGALYQKVQDKRDTEYEMEEIHWLKIMCQEIIPQVERHRVVKLQPDGSATEKHAHGVFKALIDRLKQTQIAEYTELVNRLKKMDTIPGDGLSEPRGYVFKP